MNLVKYIQCLGAHSWRRTGRKEDRLTSGDRWYTVELCECRKCQTRRWLYPDSVMLDDEEEKKS